MNCKRFVLNVFAFVLLSSSLTLQPVAAQTDDCIKKAGKDSVATLTNYSLYRESYKQKNYEDAYKGWSYVFNNAPCFREQTYADGATLLKDKISKAEDPAIKEAYIDTLMLLYDKRIKYFQKEAYVLSKKGRDHFQYRQSKLKETQAMFQRVIELAKDEIDPYMPIPYLQVSIMLLAKKEVSEMELLERYDFLARVTDQNLKNNKDTKKWSVVQQNLEVLINPYLTCEGIIKNYGERIKNEPDNIELTKKVLSLLNTKKCTDDPLYLIVAERSFNAAPSADDANSLAQGFFAAGSSDKALEYFNKAVELETDPNKKAEYLMKLADISLRQFKKCSAARNYAQKALAQNPNLGAAYMLIGDAYVTCGCGEDDFEKKTVYWVAVDKYIKAKSVDPSVAAAASSRISKYSQYFPLKSEGFYRGIHEGSSYTVECWINETTTVRLKDE